MQRLNIPLRRNQYTTRLSRRVVSLFAVLGAVLLGVLAVATVLWYGRDTTSVLAPEGTTIVLHFIPNRATWDETERALHNVPLISNRPLRIADIQPFVHGEFSLFIEADGSRSVAIRTTKRELPMEELDKLGILVTETKPGRFLLSDEPKAKMAWKPDTQWLAWFHRPTISRIGSIYFPNSNEKSGLLLATKTQIEIRIPKQKLVLIPGQFIPNDPIAVLATPLLTNEPADNLMETLGLVLGTKGESTSPALFKDFFRAPGMIALSGDGSLLHFLFVRSSDQVSKEAQMSILQTAAAFKSPKLRPLALPDQTNANEIIVDPTLMTIEETTMDGSTVSRVALSNGTYLYQTERNNFFAITDDEQLLDQWLKAKKPENSSACMGNAGYISPERLLEHSVPTAPERSASGLNLLANMFSEIGLQNTLFHTVIHLCY